MVSPLPVPSSRRLWHTQRALSVGLLLALSGCPKEEPQGPTPEELRQEADGRYLAGTAAYLQGKFEEAHGHFKKVRELTPEDPRLPAAEGEILLAEGKLGEALQTFQLAVRMDPKRSTNFSRLGYIQSLLGDRPAARDSLAKALALNPNDYNAYESLADLDLKDALLPDAGPGKLDDAVAHLRQAAEKAPDALKSSLIARAVEELGKRGRAADGLPLLEEARDAGIKSAELTGELADRYVAAGKLALAVAAYEEAARANPSDPTLWELAGEVYVKLDKPADAQAAFRESLKVKNRAVVHAAIARLCQARKDTACVKAEVEEALASAAGEESREVFELAELLASVGRKKEALELLKTIAAEEEFAANKAVQLKLARWGKEQKEPETTQAACARLADAGVSKCP